MSQLSSLTGVDELELQNQLHRPIVDLGLDSLAGMELRSWMKEQQYWSGSVLQSLQLLHRDTTILKLVQKADLAVPGSVSVSVSVPVLVPVSVHFQSCCSFIVIIIIIIIIIITISIGPDIDINIGI